MKTIYTFSLGDEVSQSLDLLNKFKAFGYLLYDELMSYENDTDNQILYHDNITFNELLESEHEGKYYYRFKYNDYESGLYEPFMIDDVSFGFTVNTSQISNEKVMEAFQQVKKITNFDYDIKIDSYDYIPDLDNINRLNVLNDIIRYRDEKNKQKGYVKVLKIAN